MLWECVCVSRTVTLQSKWNCNKMLQQQTAFPAVLDFLLSPLEEKWEKIFYPWNDVKKPDETLGVKITGCFCKAIKLYRINESQGASFGFMTSTLCFSPPSRRLFCKKKKLHILFGLPSLFSFLLEKQGNIHCNCLFLHNFSNTLIPLSHGRIKLFKWLSLTPAEMIRIVPIFFIRIRLYLHKCLCHNKQDSSN